MRRLLLTLALLVAPLAALAAVQLTGVRVW
jgi:hypothetical protein